MFLLISISVISCTLEGGIEEMRPIPEGNDPQGNTCSYNVNNRDGGGIYLNSGALTMNGGIISDNRASSGSGGGVYVLSGTFTMNGGSISGNSTL
jgi:hypothetical protein